jgi:hypothetical protein
MSDPKDGGNTAPVYNAETHRAGLQALRGQPYTGAGYQPPAVNTDQRTPEVKAFDRLHGAPDSGKYPDLNGAGLEGAGDVTGALNDLNFPAVAAQSFVESFVTANREYAGLSEAQKQVWKQDQADMLSRMPNAAEILDNSKIGYALLTKANPALAAKITCDNVLPFMTAVLLANQVQRVAVRAGISGGKS